MRRLAGTAIAAGLVLAPLASATPAHACAQPAEGEPSCCPPLWSVTVTVDGRSVTVNDPTWDPRTCA